LSGDRGDFAPTEESASDRVLFGCVFRTDTPIPDSEPIRVAADNLIDLEASFMIIVQIDRDNWLFAPPEFAKQDRPGFDVNASGDPWNHHLNRH
jgi:hypothetical protein